MAEEEAEREEEEEQARAQAERMAEEAAEEEELAAEIPEGIDAQIARLSDVRDFDDAESYYNEGDDSHSRTRVNVGVDVSPG